MDTVMIGRNIAEARKRAGLSQEKLAEKIGVTAQAVSKWENGHNTPDLDNLFLLADATGTSYRVILGDPEAIDPAELDIRERLFREANMYTRIKATALSEDLRETYRALQYMRDHHAGQNRKESKFSKERVKYINHPLMMACHAHALGLKDDVIMASILLHDVVEDTDVTLDELPFSEEVRTIVGLVTKPDNIHEEGAEEAYYAKIAENGKACMVKLIDRCNNVSTMAGCFSREKLVQYIHETEDLVLPLAKVIKDEHPEYSDAAFILKYHIISVIEAVKCMLASQ